MNAFKIKATNAASVAITQDFSVTPLGTIRGTAIDNYVTAAGNVTGLEDLTKVFIGASVLNGNAWSTIEGIAHSDGSFEIPGVPAGNYWFTAASGGYWTSATSLRFGHTSYRQLTSLRPHIAQACHGLTQRCFRPSSQLRVEP